MIVALLVLGVVSLALVFLNHSQGRQWAKERTEMVNRMQARSVSELAQLQNITTSTKPRKEADQAGPIAPTTPLF